jgi:DtxR family transcriptional regulator, Mn-dependent transcriptional regulator
MLPSHTVENYLKAIFLAQVALLPSEQLVPMGQLASALGVVPGTATTMVKALAESGLVRYEPYAGVRLTAAGEKLAARVLRRHRLIELFLVQVMGMSWTEVHDEAEHLEHAVSDRLIERIDEMLGRPVADPHGDPIPGPEGTLSRPEYDTLLTCPLGEAVTVRRVSDQDSEFLRFVERHDLKPGQVVRVEDRDPAADSVRLRGSDREFTIGARAASKVLVQAVQAVLLICLLSTAALAQTVTAEKPSEKKADEPFAITDNSFLVEEAFNQEAGIFQNIAGAVFVNSLWAFTFTQEWPVKSQAHQLSFTVSALDNGIGSGVGDTLINYRYQALTEGPGRPAFSPRASLVLPTGDVPRLRGTGSPGLQVNLPFSKQTGDWYWHWNAGFTWLPRAELVQTNQASNERRVGLMSPFFAGSSIYRVRQMFNLMLETVLRFDELIEEGQLFEGATNRETAFVLSPGARGGWNLGDQQLILGAAMPITWVGGEVETGVLLYLSYELPFRKQ